MLSLSTARKILSPPTTKKGHDVDNSPSQQERSLREKQTQTSGLTLSYQTRSAAVFTCKPNSCGCLLSFSCSQLLLAVQLSSSDAWLCRFITKQQLAHEKKKNPSPILTQLSKTEKQHGFVLGEQRTRAFGCSFSGRAAPPQWDPFPWKPAACTQLFPAEQGHPTSSPARDLRLPWGTEGEEREGDAAMETRGEGLADPFVKLNGKENAAHAPQRKKKGGGGTPQTSNRREQRKRKKQKPKKE